MAQNHILEGAGMYKGIVLSENEKCAEAVTGSINKEKLKIDICTCKLKDTVNIIDTRNIDMVIYVPEMTNECALLDDIKKRIHIMDESNPDFININTGNETFCIDKKKIIFVEVINRDSYIYTYKCIYHFKRKTLKCILEMLDDPYMVRCHKSCAVNIRNVSGFVKIRRGIWKPVFTGIDGNHEQNEECLIGNCFYEDVIAKYRQWMDLK